MRFKHIACAVVVGVAIVLAASVGTARELQKISDHVYGYVDIKNASPAGNSFGANTGLIIGTKDVMVVDTLVSAKEGKRFLADIRKITDKPIKYVVNTHYHLDHSGGNSELVKAGAVVIGHENTPAHLPELAESLKNPGYFGFTDDDLQGTRPEPPSITFKDTMTIDLGDVKVKLSYPGPTHTDDSITVLVMPDKVLFTGDVLFTSYHPFLAMGDLVNWKKVLTDLKQIPAKKIIPGHGPVSSAKDLDNMRTYLIEFDKQATALCAGKQSKDVDAVAGELLKRLPDQQRTEMPSLVDLNLKLKYLAPTAAKK
jgi:glyoxylase-like metal-dependent hydrolase (beta-lactamase superfamily II)